MGAEQAAPEGEGAGQAEPLSAGPGAPSGDLLLAHRATAYFLRLLRMLGDEDFDAPPARKSPVSRREIIATIGYDARAYAQMAEQARLGHTRASGEVETEWVKDRENLIRDGISLPARALRSLVFHSAVQLSVEWRDLPPAGWEALELDQHQVRRRLSETPWLRAASLWRAAVDLGAGGSFADAPPEVLRRLDHDTPHTLESQPTARSRGDLVTEERKLN